MSDDSTLPGTDQLLALIGIQTRIARLGPDLGAVMGLVAHEAMLLTHGTGAVIELCEGSDMVYHAVAGTASHLLGLRIRREGSLSGRCQSEGRMLYCADSHQDPRVDRAACELVGLRSMVVMPLLHDSTCVGVLKVFSANPQHFSAADQYLLNLLSAQIAASMFHAARHGHAELLRRATTDALTGLANRSLFLDRLRQSLAEPVQPQPLAVMMIDMDGLKPINDQCGHRIGDAALCEMARRIRACTRQEDTVARLGGDEFAILLPGIGTNSRAQELAERIDQQCSQPFEFEGLPLPLSASIGVALAPQDGNQPDRLLERADLLMYQHKRLRKQQHMPGMPMH